MCHIFASFPLWSTNRMRDHEWSAPADSETSLQIVNENDWAIPLHVPNFPASEQKAKTKSTRQRNASNHEWNMRRLSRTTIRDSRTTRHGEDVEIMCVVLHHHVEL